MYTQTEKVNIEPKSYLPVFRISQNDVGRTLKAHLVSDEGTIAIPTSATVTMAGIKPSGLGYTVTGIIDGSDVSFETDATMTDEAGQIESEIRIVDGETLIGTTNVVLNVEPNPHPDDTTDGQREPLVNEITALLNQITAQADRTEEYSSKVLNMTVTAHESQEPTVTKTEGEVVNLDFGLPRGEKGERGERGEQGEAGKDGKDGIDGKDGKDGKDCKDGINGVTPDFSIGTVTTLEPNESASVTLTGTEEEPVLNFGIPKGAKGEQGEVSLSDLEKIMVTDTASGAIASFPDGSGLLPALSLVANIVPKQSGSDTPSPDNVREISGWDEVNTVVSGKNLLDPETIVEGKYYNIQLAEITNANKAHSGIIPIKPSTSYCLNGFAGQSFFAILALDENKQPIVWYGGASKNEPFVATTPSNAKYAILNFNVDQVGTIAFYESATVDGYIPYQATTHTTDLGRTVYGGTVDVVRGELVVDRAMADMGSLDWAFNGVIPNGYQYAAAISGKALGETNFICSAYATGSPRQTIGYICGRAATTTVACNATEATLADFKTAVSGQQLCYELVTPTTYQLTPQQINTLAGVNNVWAESGDCSITYYADTKLYIDKKLGGN